MGLHIQDKGTLLTLQVWALAVSADEKTIVSAGADSVATFWEDSTEVEQAEKNEALVKAVQRCVTTPPRLKMDTHSSTANKTLPTTSR